jgi:Dolichyl-phosphate-mannose-protein mannosyltransferase
MRSLRTMSMLSLEHSKSRTSVLLWAIWLCFIIRAVFYSSAFPLWEGFDEYAHFATIQHIFFHRDIPDFRTANSSREVAESLKILPVPWLLRDESKGYLSHDDYWQLAPADQMVRRTQLKDLPQEWSDEEAVPRLPLYEAQQPPLYYWLMLPVYWSVKSLELPTQVWILRLVTVLLGSIVVPVAFLTGRKCFSGERGALGVAVVVASMPQLSIDIFRISNEALSVVIGSLTVLAVITLWSSPPNTSRGAIVGLAVGSALLTKAYFLSLLLWATFVLVAATLRDSKQRRAPALQLAAGIAVCVSIAGWYYIRVLALTGTFTGEQNDVGAYYSHVSWADAIKRMPWRRIFDFMAVTHIWLGNWSFLVVRTWMYRVVEFVFILALLGLLLQIIRPTGHLAKARSLICILVMPLVLLVAGLCFHAIQSFRSAENIGTMGYYLLCLVVPETIVLLWGLARLMPEGQGLLAVPALTIVFNALEQFGTTFLLLPYYAGAIHHDTRGHLPTLRISQAIQLGYGRLFGGLLVNKPSFMTPSGLMIMMILSAATSAALVIIAFSLAAEPNDLE